MAIDDLEYAKDIAERYEMTDEFDWSQYENTEESQDSEDS